MSSMSNLCGSAVACVGNVCTNARRLGIIALVVLMVLSFSEASSADMGRIRTSEARVEETAQKAIILHNLEEEVLILGTDLEADKVTTILRFIPLPSEPQVSLAKGDPFAAIGELMKKRKLVFVTISKGGGQSAQPVEIRMNARLGAHDITVVKINEIQAFRQWVEARLANKGALQSEDFARVQEIASDYVSRNIRYFVFDVVEVTPETRFVEPIVYRFKSKELFYPLKTTNTFGGKGQIDLVVVAPGTLCDPLLQEPLYTEDRFSPCCGICGIWPDGTQCWPFASTSEQVAKGELELVYSGAEEFFKAHEAVFMQLVRYNGPFKFNDDVRIDISRAPRRAYQVSTDEWFSR